MSIEKNTPSKWASPQQRSGYERAAGWWEWSWQEQGWGSGWGNWSWEKPEKRLFNDDDTSTTTAGLEWGESKTSVETAETDAVDVRDALGRAPTSLKELQMIEEEASDCGEMLLLTV